MEKKNSKEENNLTKKNTSIKAKTFKDLEGKFLLVKVGTPESPATNSQIENVQKQLTQLLEENNINCVVFVSHHAIEMEIIEKQK